MGSRVDPGGLIKWDPGLILMTVPFIGDPGSIPGDPASLTMCFLFSSHPTTSLVCRTMPVDTVLQKLFIIKDKN